MKIVYNKQIIYVPILIYVFLLLFTPSFVSANYFTLPVDVDSEDCATTAWFDHDGTASTSMTRFTGTVYSGVDADLYTCSGYGCYDEHNGIDIATTTGAHVIAPADGIVSDIYWNNDGGWTMRAWHDESGFSTLYAHIATTTIATTSDMFVRGNWIAYVDSTGAGATDPHLHFGVTDGIGASSNRIDPFGWWDDEVDPDENTQGYLWTTDPPSFDLAKEVTGNITSDTTWRGNIVVSGVVTVNSGVTLNVDPGTVVKIKTTTSRLVVNGTLDVQGSTTSPVYFTSYKDDIGGDTNGDGDATSQAAGDWKNIELGSTGSSTISNAVVRYGGRGYYGSDSYANIYNNGGILTISDSQIATSSFYGIRTDSGTTTATSTEINNNSYGVYFTGGAGSSSVSNCSIHNNSSYGIYNSTGTLDAENNYWGDSSGPYHPTSNPDGAGDTVSNYIDFDPWLEEW